ncbi:hypothetical protein F5Y02DRAFT_424114 [Annulohypoxylon stygium]|nr:hypothetical protein F5Y02DRAFT_424114 [Annulohypoxylon stygium]
MPRASMALSPQAKFPSRSYGNDHFGPDEESGDHGKPGEIGDRPDSDTEQETNYQSSSDEEELDRQSFALLDLPSGESFITATSLQYGNTAKKADEPEPPSQIDTRRIKSAKSKQSIIQITISDDQSCDSEFSQRRLKALLTKPSLVGDYDYDITKPNNYGDGLMTSATTSAQGPDDASKHELNNQNPALAMALHMIHRVSTNDGKKTATGQKMYLDMPQWVEGASSSRDALVGNLVIQDIPAYLSEHPDICFLHAAETIEIFAEELLAAVEKFLEYYEFLDATEFNKLPAPYFFIYHAMRNNLDEFLKILDDKAQQQFQTLLGYVNTEYADEYHMVDEMTSRGKITHAFIHYLFKPGDIVVNLMSQPT